MSQPDPEMLTSELVESPPEANVKNGVQTSEFWITMIKIVVAAVVSLLALLHPGFKEPGWVQGAVPIAAAVMSHLSGILYTRYRSMVKVQALTSGRAISLFPHPPAA